MNWQAALLFVLAGVCIGCIGTLKFITSLFGVPKPGDWDEQPPEVGMFRSWIRSGWARGVGACKAALAAAHEYTPRDSQHVLKAEPAMADATDRSPTTASPRVGAMGSGQPADAGPMQARRWV